MRRAILVLALVGLVRPGARVFAQAAETKAPAPAPILDDAGREAFLLEGEIVRTRNPPKGVTNTIRATLSRDGYSHDAHIQAIDEHKTSAAMGGGVEIDFRDTYKNNVAAYRLDRLLGLGMVPVSVVRRHENKLAAFTWWVDDVIMDEEERVTKKRHTPDAEAWNRQMYVVRAFDQLIFNFDRNLGNLLVDKDWRIWMIDHTRAFKIFKVVANEKELGPRIPRAFLAALRRLDEPTLRPVMKDLLDGAQIQGLLKRRDQVVAHYDKKIAESGEAAVLYDLPSRVIEPAPEPR
jgi:hypothetical protein